MHSFLSAIIVASVALAPVFAEDLKGDIKAGEKKNAMCTGCHGIVGYQASFPEVYKVPKIAGQSEKYIVSSLNAYKSGSRKHPSMKGIAASLSDQDMADLAAFYANQGVDSSAVALAKAPEGNKTEAALLAKGNCASCHGESLSKPIDPSYPKIAGQHRDYLFVALKSYKVENGVQWGRANAIMGGIAKQYSNDELKTLANYIGRLQGEMKTVPESRFR